jgi:hypothetical protein
MQPMNKGRKDKYDLEHLLNLLSDYPNKAELVAGADFKIDGETTACDGYNYVRFAEGNIRIDAYMPTKPGFVMSCAIRLKGSGFLHGFTQEQIEKTFLSKTEFPLEKQPYFLGQSNSEVWLQFPGVRVTTDSQTANDLVKALKKLKEEKKI